MKRDLFDMPDCWHIKQHSVANSCFFGSCAFVYTHMRARAHAHTSHTHSPRDALKRAQAALKEKSGLTIKTGVELEFHLLSAEDTSKMADGHDTAPKPCYNVEPLMRQVCVAVCYV